MVFQEVARTFRRNPQTVALDSRCECRDQCRKLHRLRDVVGYHLEYKSRNVVDTQAGIFGREQKHGRDVAAENEAKLDSDKPFKLDD